VRDAVDAGPRGWPAGAVDALTALLDLVVQWNRRIDLTAARDADELVDLLVADAAVLAKSRPAAGSRWVDVGSGAGAPGLVLALLVPSLVMTLVEPRDKRVAFLRTAIGKLGRDDILVERARSDRLAAARWDIAVSRATLPPVEWLREGSRLATRAVWVLLARESAPELAGWRADHDERYVLPLTGAERRVVRFVPEPT
jgi:16S rRNA (guanine527-N7)-methyltransferase